MWLTLLAMRNAIAVLMASLAVVVLGYTSLSRMSIDLFPNINLPIITVGTQYTGANVQDIEKTVTYPVEKAVSAVANVHHVESKSRQGISAVAVWLNYDADMNAAQTEVIQRIQQILNTLPTGIKQPFIVRADLSNIPVCLLTVSGGGLDEKQLYDLAFNTVEPQIERLNGVAAANVDGGKVRQIAVNLNRDLLYAKGISVLDVVRAVNDANFLLPSGGIKVGTVDYQLFTNNQFQLVRPMEDIVVRRFGEVPVHVRDLGYVTDSFETQTSVVRVDGERSVYLRVNKQPGANTVDVVDAVKKTLPQLIGIPAGVKVGLTFDQSTYIRQSIESLWHEAGQGAVLAFLVILFFLGSLVSTAIIFIAIPLSILGTFIAMYFLGQTINVFTLGGLALAVGRLVDDSIVELENINRHLAMPGTERRRAVLDAAREVAMPIFVSTITTIVVFLPTIFIEGQAKLLFLPLTFTISFSLFASFLVSRTVTPLLCFYWLKPEGAHDPHRRRWWDRVLEASRATLARLDLVYQRTLAWALRHRKLVVFGVFAVFLLSLGLYPLIGTEFFPASDESQFRVFVRAPIGTRVEETEKITARIEQIIRSNLPAGELKSIVTSVGIPSGRSAIFTSNTGPHAAQVQVYLSTPDKRKRSDAQIVNAIRPKFAGQFPGTITFFNLGGIINRVLNRGSQNPLELEVLGYDLQDARAAAGEAARLMREIPNVADVQISREENYPQFSVVVDREKAASAGLSQRDIAQAALFSLNSNVSVNPSIFTDPRTGNQYNIVVQLDEPFRVRPEDLGKIFVTAAGGRPLVLSTIADIKRSFAPVEIERKYQQRLIRISANPVGRDLGAISSDIDARLGSLRLPPGFEVRLGGQTAQQREAFASLFFTTILALMLVYMVMASQFRSLKDPFIIMFSVPMGLIGVLWALFVTRTTLSTTSFMGIIMMVGIVVSNGVLLVEYTNELRRRGRPLADAVVTAGRTRLRPILMTSLTTIVGLLPMALGLLVGSEANAPLARAVIGGLLVSTCLTLLLIPTLYTMLEERFPRTFRAEDARAS
ncbi:MAG TPA: efflux RND transporter permease subunit [Methylomirabilota bacterium]|jgi:CzcA family heavy metal efflux pump|nr:efflux RND transporter permease subunit [Methylomirabilota bacterium]